MYQMADRVRRGAGLRVSDNGMRDLESVTWRNLRKEALPRHVRRLVKDRVLLCVEISIIIPYKY
jgi:hypothetical protein